MVLGSGAWSGIPAPFCSCRVCVLAASGPASKNNRTRPQFLLENRGGSFLLEVSPDIRLQSATFGLPPIRDFVVSHWHYDHMYGLHELLTWMKQQPQKPTVHCSAKTAAMIEKEFSYLPLQVNVLRPLEPFTLFGVVITPLPVYHMFDRDDRLSGESLENTFGYLFEGDHTRVVYLADYYRIPQTTLQKIQGADAVIADGTYLLTDQYKEFKPNHLHGGDILRFTTSLGAKIVYYHSISHLTQKTHEELQQSLPTSHLITYDGMKLL